MHIFFDGWQGIVRTLVLGVLAYAMLVIYLRLSGLRTLSKMNAFDFIVTIALGSTLAAILLSKEVTLAEGAVAVGTLVGLQFLVTWVSVRARWVRKAITGEPLLLLYEGQLLEDALKRARVTPDEIHTALRGAGLQGMQNAHAVVLETDGTFTVLPQGEQKGTSSLDGVVGAPTT